MMRPCTGICCGRTCRGVFSFTYPMKGVQMAEKLTSKERLKEINDSIIKGVTEVFTSGKYAEYLRTMSRFHHYSARNRVLIHAQLPTATHIAGYQAWQNKFERHVIKGAKGIKILAPAPIKRKIEKEKLDPDTKVPMLDENGDVITEEKEIKIPMFKPVTVFDVSQTEGKPLPVLAETLVGDVQNYDVFMEAIRRSSPVPIIKDPMQQNMDGYFSLAEQNIHIREGMSEVQTVCAAIHEITHAKLHNTDAEERKNHKIEEIEAESVAYAVCAYYGIETDANSFGYIANYVQGKDAADLLNALDLIGKTSDALIADIDRHYGEIMRERSAERELAAKPEPQEHLYLLDHSKYLHLQASGEGYNYTVYEADSKKEIQRGVCSKPNVHFHTACMQICELLDLGNDSVVEAKLCELERDNVDIVAPKRGNGIFSDNSNFTEMFEIKSSVLEQLKAKAAIPKKPKIPQKLKENER